MQSDKQKWLNAIQVYVLFGRFNCVFYSRCLFCTCLCYSVAQAIRQQQKIADQNFLAIPLDLQHKMRCFAVELDGQTVD